MKIFLMLSVISMATGVLRAADYTFESDSLRLELAGGVVVRLTNKLTGEDLVSGGSTANQPLGIGCLTGEREEPLERLYANRPAQISLSMHRPGEESVRLSDAGGVQFRGLQAGAKTFPRETYAVSCLSGADGECRLVLRGVLDEGSMAYGISFTVAGIGDARVIAPVVGGQCFGRETPDFRKCYDYTYSWDCPLVLLQGGRGGVSIWCDDPDFREKRLFVEHAGGKFTLTFLTMRNEGARARDVATPEWHFTPYVGNWTVPAGRYRDLMAKRWDLKPLASYEPAWVRDIRVVCIGGAFSRERIDRLAGLFDPSTVLLYNLVGTRVSPPDAVTDIRYPDPGYKDMVDYARRRGFHVFEFNYYCMLSMPGGPNSHYDCPDKRPDCGCLGMGGPKKLYDEFLPYIYDRYNQGKRDVLKSNLGFVHTGCGAWRHLVMDGIQTRAATYGIDGFYMDTSGLARYHPRGPVEGKNFLQGEIAYWRELRQRFPACAFFAEGVTETTPPGAAFGYRNHAVRHSLDSDRERDIFRMSLHPVSAYIFSLFTWGYVPFEDILVNETVGCIPVFDYTHTVDDLFLMTYARLYAARKLRRIYPDNWEENVVSYHVDSGGRTLKYARCPDGDRMVGEDTAGETVVLGRLHGVRRGDLRPGLNVIGWPACSGNTAIGLNPERWYPYVETGRPERLAVSSLPGDCSISRIVDCEAYTSLTLEALGNADTAGTVTYSARSTPRCVIGAVSESGPGVISMKEPGTVVWMWRDPQPVDTGAATDLLRLTRYVHRIGPDGFEKAIAWPVMFNAMNAEIGKVKRPSFAARPAEGELAIDFALSLPETPVDFEFFAGTADPAGKKVIYEVRVNGRRVFEEKTGVTAEWLPRRIPLAAWAGRTTLLSLVTKPVDTPYGPNYVFWGEPRLISP